MQRLNGIEFKQIESQSLPAMLNIKDIKTVLLCNFKISWGTVWCQHIWTGSHKLSLLVSLKINRATVTLSNPPFKESQALAEILGGVYNEKLNQNWIEIKMEIWI